MFSPAVVGAILLVSLGAVLGDSLTREQREDPNVRVTDDAVIIEVTGSVRHRREIVDAQAKEEVDKKSERSSRQFFIGQGFVIPNAFLGSYPSLRASPTLGTNSIRAGGHLFQDGNNPFENTDIPFQNGAVLPNAAPAGRLPLPHAPCITASGQRGKCASFRECYPYFKVPDLASWGPWVFGGYDTCNYYSEQIKQPDVFQTLGVCCVSPVTLEGDGSFNPAIPPVVAPVDPEYTPVVAAVDPAYEAPAPLDEPDVVETLAFGPPSRFTPFAGWPPAQPPLPTHPPDHAAPTHPPSGQFTTKAPTIPSTTTKKPLFTTWGTKQTTKATQKPIWPPAVPTHGPPSQTTVSPGSSETHSYSCGGKNGHQDQERIVGGHNAEPNEWPWIVALFSNGRQFCGGSLIDNQHILTAAHCVAHMTSHDVAGVTARLGDHDIHVNHEVRHIEKRLKRVVRHKGFDMRTLYNDISVLTLDSPVAYSKTIRPICLARGGDSFAGSTGTVIGWGSLREGGAQPSVLQEVSIPIWTNAECRSKYGPAAPGGIVEHMLCAGRATKDSCSGDSGGPLTVAKDGTWYQVGVVSWGIGCGKGQYPGVYSRVSSFLPWITKNTS